MENNLIEEIEDVEIIEDRETKIKKFTIRFNGGENHYPTRPCGNLKKA